jgi:hypothetical protein
MAIQLNSNSEFIPVDTRFNAGTIILPLANAIPGRVITLKDAYGTFGRNPLFLSTQNGDIFEDNTNLKAMRNTYGFVTLACDGVSEWTILNGTLFPMYTISSLQVPIEVTVENISTTNLNFFLRNYGTVPSTIALKDQTTNATFSFFTRSTILYYGGLPVAGVKAGAGQFFTVN